MHRASAKFIPKALLDDVRLQMTQERLYLEDGPDSSVSYVENFPERNNLKEKQFDSIENIRASTGKVLNTF